MPYTLKPERLERIRPLVERGLNGAQIAKAVGIREREARWYAQQIRAGRTAPNGSGLDSTPPAVTIDEIPLAHIHIAGETQARARLDHHVIKDYAEAMTEGATFPPVVLFFDGDEGFYIGDGFHRIHAAQQIGFTTIRAEVRQRGARAAQLYAANANQTHGLRRTNADKRRAVLILLADEEWRAWSDREIARHCGVTHPFVAKLRQELSGNDYQMVEPRQARRGETVYAMDTRNIGAHEATVAPANGESADVVDTFAVPVVEGEVDALDTHPIPVTEPEVDNAEENAWDEETDGEEKDFTIYLSAWEALSRAHVAWASHVTWDRQLAIEMVIKGAGADVGIHIEALRETAASLQDFAAALQAVMNR